LFTDRSFFSATSLAIFTSTPVTFPATPPATSRTTHPAVHPFVVPATMQYSQLILAVLLLTSARAALNSRRARQFTVSANTGLLQAREQSPSAAAGQQSAAAGQQSAAAGQQSAAAGRQFNFKIRHSRAAHSTSSKSHQRRGSSVDFNTDQRPIVPLTGKSDRPTGYLMKRSEDEVPRCMKDDIKKRGKVHKVPNVYAVPGFLDAIHQESEKPIGIQNSAVSGDTRKNYDLQSDDEISSDWSTEVEYPRYQDETPVYSSVKRPASGLKTTGTEAQTNNVETQKLNNYAKYDTAGVDLESSCVPLYQCQTLNADYEQVAYDSDDGSEISLAEESYFLTHVNNGHDGRLKLETDM
ncbi:hypothetical protein FHG87_024219, partial [Trinorchestia longiramus]